MGHGIARSLLRAGLPVWVHDVRAEAVSDMVELGAIQCISAQDVATTADIIAIVVYDAAQVEEVLFSDDGVAAADRPVIALVCSTLAVSEVERIVRKAESTNVRVVDVGIAGGPDAAVDGCLVTLVGGDEDLVSASWPVLEAMSADIVHAGPTGSGMKLKLVKNAMSFTTMCAVHEALLLGEELGFDPALLRRVAERSHVVDQFFYFPMTRPSARPLGNDADDAALAAAGAGAAIARKDLAAAMAAGASVGVELPVIQLAEVLADRYFLAE
jgi:3-hydroxyisobutyrate dehydrogenase-like beta-hydroxyacid dehydrogenase